MACDGEIWLSVRASLLSGGEGLRFCVDAVDFLKVLRNLGETTVDCEVDLSNSTITCVHSTGRFTLPCQQADEFPRPVALGSEIVGDITLSLSLFNRAMDAVRFCVADETLRPTLNGVNVAFSPRGMVTVATDGNRLARCFDDSIAANDDFSFILPKKATQSLLSLSDVDEVHLRLDNRAIDVECYGFKMTSRLIEGRYPNYNSVIPSSSELKVSLDKNAIVTALRRVMPLGNNTSQLTTLCFTDNSLVVESRDDDFNKSGREFVECDYRGDELTIGFKVSALIDVFNSISGDTVVMELTDASHACVVHAGNRDEYLSILMPMLL